MVEYKEKWNRYIIGEIPWINLNRDKISRYVFANYVRFRKDIKSVIEIGAGECIEAKELKDDVDYTVMDVSDLFLSHAKALGVKTIKCCMTRKPKIEKKYDLVYLSSVLEHTPNLKKTINVIKSIAKNYYVIMFRWSYGGNIYSQYKRRRKCFSSTFGIKKVFELFGSIEGKIITDDDKTMKYEEYEKTIDKSKEEHRNGKYLSFWGKC